MTDPDIRIGPNLIACCDRNYLLNWLEKEFDRVDSSYLPLGRANSTGWCVYMDADAQMWEVTFTNKQIDKNFKADLYTAYRVERCEELVTKVTYKRTIDET